MRTLSSIGPRRPPETPAKGSGGKDDGRGMEDAANDGKGVVLCSTPSAIPFYIAMGVEPVGAMYIRDEECPGMRIKPTTPTVALS